MCDANKAGELIYRADLERMFYKRAYEEHQEVCVNIGRRFMNDVSGLKRFDQKVKTLNVYIHSDTNQQSYCFHVEELLDAVEWAELCNTIPF